MTTNDQQLATIENETYTSAQVDLIRRTVAADCTTDELALFLEVCRLSGLNPFLRQVYAIKRGDRMTVQTGIDGYRLLAARTGALAGIDDATYDSEERDHPAWASVTVWRIVQGQRVPFSAKARWSEYAAVGRDDKPVAMWAKMPYLMLGKCAEALALRKAFPAELSGVYTAEEMAQADNPTPTIVNAAPAASAPLPPAPRALPVDPVAIALRDQKTLDLLVEMGRIGPEDQYREVESVITAIAARGGVRNHSVIRAELRQRMQDARDLSAEADEASADLADLPVGVRGN